MKRILVVMLCLMLLFATPVMAFAAEGEVETEQPITSVIVTYVQEHFEEITVVIATAVGAYLSARYRTKLDGSIGTLNNNAITVSKNSEETVKAALAGVEGIAEVVNKYKDEIEALLCEIRKSAEEKKALEDTLAHVEALLHTSKLATTELANEVAELLVLANIPVSKKEELYSRHMAAVNAIAEAESEVTNHDGEEA